MWGSNRFLNNEATWNGAAMYLLGHVNLVQDEDSTVVFQGNKAGRDGGAMYAEELPPRTTEVPLSISIKSAEYTSNEAARHGGAICLVGGTLDLVEQINFAGNEIPDDDISATDIGGGAIALVSYQRPLSVRLQGARFVNNIATGASGGAIGWFHLDAADITRPAAGSSVAIEQCLFMNNKAGSYGGAVEIAHQYDASLNFRFTDVNFTSNEAESDGGAVDIYASEQGVVTLDFISSGPPAAASTAFQQNRAEEGGALWAWNVAVTFDGVVKMEGNEAEDIGGALYAEDSQLTFTGNLLQVLNNKATSFEGGAFHLLRTDLNIQAPAFFHDNSAASVGGALAVEEGSTSMVQASFMRNSADRGGAVYSSSSNSVTMISFGQSGSSESSTTLVGNSAASEGGALYLGPYSEAAFHGAACISSNTAGQAGGAVQLVVDSEDEDPPPRLTFSDGRQSLGANTVGTTDTTKQPNTFNIPTGALVYCGNSVSSTTSDAFPPGNYTIEGPVCTNYSSTPIGNNCPAGQNSCSCPNSMTFNVDTCACSQPPPPSRPTPPSFPIPVPDTPIPAARLVLSSSNMNLTGLQVGSVTNWAVSVAVINGLAGDVTVSVRLPPGLEAQGPGCSVTNGSSTLTCNIGGLSFGKPNVTTVLQLRAVSAGTGLIVVNATGVSVLGAAFQTRATQLGACCSDTPLSPAGACTAAWSAANCSGVFNPTANCSSTNSCPSPVQLSAPVQLVTAPVGQKVVVSYNIVVGNSAARAVRRRGGALYGDAAAEASAAAESSLMFSSTADQGLTFLKPLPEGCAPGQAGRTVTCQLSQAAAGQPLQTGLNFTVQARTARSYTISSSVLRIMTGGGQSTVASFNKTVIALGACCNARRGDCQHATSASECGNPGSGNTFLASRNCLTATCSRAGLTVQFDQPENSTTVVGEAQKYTLVITAARAVATDVTATVILPQKSLVLNGAVPRGCQVVDGTRLTCQTPRIAYEKTRKITLSVKAVSAGDATLTATVDSPSGVGTRQSRLRITVMGACCITRGAEGCTDTTHNACKQAGGRFNAQESCKTVPEAFCG